MTLLRLRYSLVLQQRLVRLQDTEPPEKSGWFGRDVGALPVGVI
jgi:hypothetical protein